MAQGGIFSIHDKGCSSPLMSAIASSVKARCEKCFPITEKSCQEVEKIKCFLTPHSHVL